MPSKMDQIFQGKKLDYCKQTKEKEIDVLNRGFNMPDLSLPTMYLVRWPTELCYDDQPPYKT